MLGRAASVVSILMNSQLLPLTTSISFPRTRRVIFTGLLFHGVVQIVENAVVETDLKPSVVQRTVRRLSLAHGNHARDDDEYRKEQNGDGWPTAHVLRPPAGGIFSWHSLHDHGYAHPSGLCGNATRGTERHRASCSGNGYAASGPVTSRNETTSGKRIHGYSSS
jgi:hypothetical protein